MLTIIALSLASAIGTVTESDVYPSPTASDVDSVVLRSAPCKAPATGKCWTATAHVCVTSKVEGVPQKCSSLAPVPVLQSDFAAAIVKALAK